MSVDQQSGLEMAARLRAAVGGVFEVHDVTVGSAIRLGGRLLTESERAYELVSRRFGDLGYTALFRQEKETDVILAIPGPLPTASSRLWLNALFLIATIASTMYVGATMTEPGPGGELNLLAGWPFATSLLSILLAHELGHYFVARHLGTPVTLPFFIPMPLGPFGTLGAFIQMKAPPTNRRSLLAIAAAGPLAGLALTIPILILGLSLSPVLPISLGGGGLQEGNSLLYAALKLLLFGRFLPGGGLDVFLHPVAFAGWAGLLVTGLNLLPAGQLDGGHVAYALLGERAWLLTTLVIVALIPLGFAWNGWFLWAFLIAVLGRRHATPLDDVTRLDSRRQALAIVIGLIFILVFTPIPLTVH